MSFPLGYFASQPTSLLTALCDGGGGARIDLLVIPVETNDDIADTAMTIAATPTNQLPAPNIIPAATIIATQTQQADAAATNEGMNELQFDADTEAPRSTSQEQLMGKP